MARATGSNTALKMLEEVAWGTTPGSGTVYGINLKSESLGMTKNTFQSDMINTYRCVIGLGDGNRAVAGSITMDLLPEGMEVLFHHLLGQSSAGVYKTTTGSGPYTHVMLGQPYWPVGLSIEKGFTGINQFFKLSGCRINSLNVNLTQEGFHEATWDFVGKDEATGQTTLITGAGTYPTKNGFTGYQVTLSVDSGAGYVALGNPVSGSFTINNNIDTGAYILGSAVRAAADLGKRECSGSFEIFFEDVVLYALYVAGTEVGLKIAFTNGTQTMTFEFPKVKLSGKSPDIAGPQGINLPLTFNARYDTGIGSDVRVTLVNTIATF